MPSSCIWHVLEGSFSEPTKIPIIARTTAAEFRPSRYLQTDANSCASFQSRMKCYILTRQFHCTNRRASAKHEAGVTLTLLCVQFEHERARLMHTEPFQSIFQQIYFPQTACCLRDLVNAKLNVRLIEREVGRI